MLSALKAVVGVAGLNTVIFLRKVSEPPQFCAIRVTVTSPSLKNGQLAFVPAGSNELISPSRSQKYFTLSPIVAFLNDRIPFVQIESAEVNLATGFFSLRGLVQ